MYALEEVPEREKKKGKMLEEFYCIFFVCIMINRKNRQKSWRKDTWEEILERFFAGCHSGFSGITFRFVNFTR